MTANGEVQSREESTVYVKASHLFVTVILLDDTPAVSHSENSAKITDIPTSGPVVKKHISPKMAN